MNPNTVTIGHVETRVCLRGSFAITAHHFSNFRSVLPAPYTARRNLGKVAPSQQRSVGFLIEQLRRAPMSLPFIIPIPCQVVLLAEPDREDAQKPAAAAQRGR